MKQDRTSKLHVRPALVVLALAAAGLLAGCATPLSGMPHDAPPVDTDPIAELRRLGEAVVAEPRNADLRARYLARRDALAVGWLNEAERARRRLRPGPGAVAAGVRRSACPGRCAHARWRARC